MFDESLTKVIEGEKLHDLLILRCWCESHVNFTWKFLSARKEWFCWRV